MALMRFWLDANVFIEAKNGPYSFEFSKSFWAWLDAEINHGRIVCPKRVYGEIVGNEDPRDELSRWVKNRRESGLCIYPDRSVQECVRKILDHVFAKYEQIECLEFSRGADPWLIAHAMDDQGIVVTHESAHSPLAKKVLIPNVCLDFGVRCVNIYAVLKMLKASI